MTMTKGIQAESQYIDGYVPSSLDAQHSSLQRSSTWIGMGFILAVIPMLGILVFGLAATEHQEHANLFAIGGIIAVVGFAVLGSALIHLGRRNYKEYKKRSGRVI